MPSVPRSSRSRLVAALLVLLAACPACGEVQEAEPLSKTVPVAGIIILVGLGALTALIRGVVRRAGHVVPSSDGAPPLTYPRATAALVLAPTALVGGFVTAGLGTAVAVGYREPHVDLFTWRETVQLTLALTAAAVVAHALAGLVALAVTSARPRIRLVGRVILAVVAAVSCFASGFGLLWVPAIILAFQLRDPLPGATVGSGSVAPAGNLGRGRSNEHDRRRSGPERHVIANCLSAVPQNSQ